MYDKKKSPKNSVTRHEEKKAFSFTLEQMLDVEMNLMIRDVLLLLR